MSQSEESSISSAGDEEDLPLSDEPISALAPELEAGDHHVALQHLQELYSAGKISEEKMVQLKANFILLQDTLKRFQASELKLLQEVNQIQAELMQKQKILEKADLYPENLNPEISRMKQQLVQVNTKLWESEKEESQRQYTITCLQQEISLLEQELDFQNQPGKIKDQSEILQKCCEEMRMEIDKYQEEIKVLNKNMAASFELIQKQKQESEKKKAELARIIPIPKQLRGEAQELQKLKLEAERQHAELMEELQVLEQQHSRSLDLCTELNQKLQVLRKENESHMTDIEMAERKNSLLSKELQMAREKESVLQQHRLLLEVKVKNSMFKFDWIKKKLSLEMEEKNKQLIYLKKMQREFNISKSSLQETEELYNQKKTTVNEGKARAAEMEKKCLELYKQKKILIQKKTDEVQELMPRADVLHTLKAELKRLHALTDLRVRERDRERQKLMDAQLRYRRLEEEARSKQLQVNELKDECQLIQRRLNSFSTLHDLFMEEGNKYKNLLQMSSRCSSEMSERIKMQENEIEILRTAAHNKGRLIQKNNLKVEHSHKVQDIIKKDLAKMVALQKVMQQKIEQQNCRISKLREMFTTKEQQLQHLHQNYDSAVQNRNQLSLQLLERERELCVACEKFNVQENLIRERSEDSELLNQQINSLRGIISEEHRQIQMCKKQLDHHKSLEEQQAVLQIQLSECVDQITSLEKNFNDQMLKEGMRELGGADPTPASLVKTIQQLKLQLTEKEAQLHERELLYHQVDRLTKNISLQVEREKPDSLRKALKVNEVKGHLIKTDRRLMAVKAELAMYQAQAQTLQQELREKQLEVDSCHLRMESGLAPSESAEEAWHKHLKRQADMDRKEGEQMEKWVQLPNGVYSTTERRPGAYIPADDPVPVPKPYGALAPFKPSTPGSNMRHIRKPQPKPMDISQ